MSLIPTNVNFLASAASSAAKARHAIPITFTKDSLDVAIALKCIGGYQLQYTIEELQRLDEEENAAPLIAAARTFQSSAEHLWAKEKDLESFNELMIYASLANAMYGNFPGAKAALLRVQPEHLTSTPIRCIAAVVCDAANEIAIREHDPVSGIDGFRWNWYHALRSPSPTERDEKLSNSIGILRHVASSSLRSDQALSLNIEVAMRQACRLSTASLYQDAPEIPEWFVKNSINAGIVTLLPPQCDLLSRRRVARAAGNSLFTLPTSTGKTFIAEACMAAASNEGGLSIFVAPYVAIGEQVRASLRVKLEGHLALISMFGGFKFESLGSAGKGALVVMTPERFDAWLRSSANPEDIRLVVFDEMHIIENGQRGSRVEGLISRLRLLQSRSPQLRLIGLSAVLVEPERVCQWMGVTPENLHRMSWRPTARRIAVCRADGSMQWVHGYDSLRPTAAQPHTPITTSIQINLPEVVYPAKNPIVYESKASRNAAAIALDLLNRLGEPGLAVCRTRADTRLLATSLSNQLPRSEHADILGFANSVVEKYDWLAPLAECVRHGIAYHNASLPYDVRREIENFTRGRLIRIVCSTTTLAEGADLPFRWTLLTHWLGSDGKALKSMAFRNIAGRNGRAGVFTEGDTVIFENRGGPPGGISEYRVIEQT